jgi:hypothetical protein
MQLKPCPFCGSHTAPQVYSQSDFNTDYDINASLVDDGYFVVCNALNGGCGTMSGWMFDSDTTASTWNKRTLNLQTKRRGINGT